ncbi:MAG: ArsR family transcriptional regulator [Pirellulaceae bacterium]
MTTTIESSDTALLDLLRKHESLSVAQLAAAMEVTATAVRQRLTRLLAQADVQRTTLRAGRGRPVHRYELTEKGRRRAGANYADLAVALWEEIRGIEDPGVRRGLLGRISGRMAALYASQVNGSTLDERMDSLAEIFRERQIPFEVDRSGDLPMLHAAACPYPGLAERDRSVCAMEKNLFSELLGQNVRLSHCRLDGDACCTFEPTAASAIGPDLAGPDLPNETKTSMLSGLPIS